MFGMNSLKELDMMSVILISVSVILIIYIIRRSSNYSGSLMEGLANRSNGSNDTKYKFATAIKNWETAIKNIPEGQKQYLNLYEAELNKLKEQQ